MTEQEVTVQAADEGRRWPVAVLLVGVVVYLGSIVGLSTTQTWVDVAGLSWSTVTTVFLLSTGVGLALAMLGWNVWYGATDDEPDPLAGIERELTGLRQEMAALRGKLAGRSRGEKP